MKKKIDTRKYLPTFENDFLQSVVASIRKRHKSLKHFWNLSCERIVERVDDHVYEKLELDFRPSGVGDRVSVRVFIWSDREIFVDARDSLRKGGWKWEWSTRGRLVGTAKGAAIVEKMEATLSNTSLIGGDHIQNFEEIWGNLIAQGPRSLK